MDKKKYIGEKIKRFRTERGLSQLDLELEIDTSPGRISKIENNKINPNKETVLKIADALKLTDMEIAYLFGIETNTSSDLLNVINELNELEDTEGIMNKAVDDLSYYLDYQTVAIFILDKENTLWFKYYSRNKLTDEAIKISGIKYQEMHVNKDSEEGSKNLLLNSAVDGKTYQSDNFILFGIGVVDKNLLKLMEKAIRFKQGLAIPLITKEKSIGSMFFVKKNRKNYDLELPILEAVARQIAIILERKKG